MTPIPGPEVGLNAAVAAELRAERAAMRMTVAALAEASDVPFPSLRRYLNAERHIDVNVLGQLAAALSTSPDRIVSAAYSRLGRDGYVLAAMEENPGGTPPGQSEEPEF